MRNRFALLLAALVMVAACGGSATPTPAAKGAAPAAAASGGKPVTKSYSAPPTISIDPNKDYRATLATTLGDIKIQLLPKDAPTAVNNFVFLARDHYYDGVKFHRVIKGFMIQGGDPTGTGRGGPGYRFKDELEKAPRNGYKKGTVAMANAGPDTNGSQFFIMDADYPLPPQYVAFGQVTDGQDIVAKIASVPVGGPERSTPNQDVVMNTVTVEER